MSEWDCTDKRTDAEREYNTQAADTRMKTYQQEHNISGPLRCSCGASYDDAHVADPIITVNVSTRKPEKYLLIDRDTGDQWEIRDGHWKRARNPVTL